MRGRLNGGLFSFWTRLWVLSNWIGRPQHPEKFSALPGGDVEFRSYPCVVTNPACQTGKP